MNALAAWLDRYSLYVALLAAWVATLGSLYFSEVAGYIPCTLCWYQRILMYPLALLLGVGLLRWDAHLPVLVLPFSLSGLALALYHYLLEKTDLFTEGAVCSAGVSCTTAWINWFGFVTIPFLSLLGFLTITLMALIALHAGEPSAPPDAAPPVVPVAAIVAFCILAYVLLAWVNRPAAAPMFTVIHGDMASQAQSRPPPAAPVSQMQAAEPATRGMRLFNEACANCHGVQGEGVDGLGGSLAGIVWADEAALLALIRGGRAADDPNNQSGIAMPPRGGRPDLTDTDLLAIIHYLRTELATPVTP